jgi:hypothetical protein
MPTGSTDPHSLTSRLKTWERIGIILFFIGLVGFGGLVEMRSAFLRRHMTDLGVYLRAAWAIRVGINPYEVTDSNGWHYQYPPLFAILMAPLADPPLGADRTGILPFAVSVAIWYLFSLFCLALAVHLLANALEANASLPAIRSLPRGCRRWWALRLLPVLACLPAIGHTLMRGQVNLLLLLLLCGMIAALIQRQSVRAGFWLAGAICLKVIPAFLLLIPGWRRDDRYLATCGLGLVLGFAVVPLAVFGWSRTWTYYREYAGELLGPALGQGTGESRAKEILEMTANDSQSLQAAIHNTIYLDRATRPTHAAPAVRLAHWTIGGLLTLITLWAAGRRHGFQGSDGVLSAGALIINMLLLSPVCHLHYFCLAVPVIMGILASAWEDRVNPRLGWKLTTVLSFYFMALTLPNLQGLEMIRDLAGAMYGALLLWVVACGELIRRRGLSLIAVESDVSKAAA